MGFCQEIISMFILYWVPVLYILGPAILHTRGPKFGTKSVPSFWQKVDGILPRNHINVHHILGACTLYTGATLGYLGLPWAATLGFLGLPWATLGYLGLRWATWGYLGLPWATLGYLDRP
jgi:hypothetical protein